MRWADEITLIALADPADVDDVNANGFPVEPEEIKTTVFGNVKSTGYSEFWKAAQAGYEGLHGRKRQRNNAHACGIVGLP